MSDIGNGPQQSKKWGKGKTDSATWWEKGCKSPNLGGLPKGSKNQKTKYKKAFNKKLIINLDGEDKLLTFSELGYHQLAQQSGAGNLKAIAMQLALDEKFDPPETVPPTAEEAAADFATLDSWIELREKFSALKKSGNGAS